MLADLLQSWNVFVYYQILKEKSDIEKTSFFLVLIYLKTMLKRPHVKEKSDFKKNSLFLVLIYRKTMLKRPNVK